MTSTERNPANNISNIPIDFNQDISQDLGSPPQNPILNDNIAGANSPTFHEEQRNTNDNREFNLSLLSETVKCEEIITNSTDILLHFLILAWVFFLFLMLKFEFFYLFISILTIEIISFMHFIYKTRKRNLSIFKSSSSFLEFINIILTTVFI